MPAAMSWGKDQMLVVIGSNKKRFAYAAAAINGQQLGLPGMQKALEDCELVLPADNRGVHYGIIASQKWVVKGRFGWE